MASLLDLLLLFGAVGFVYFVLHSLLDLSWWLASGAGLLLGPVLYVLIQVWIAKTTPSED